jgi:hypothetical protein
MSQSQLPTDHSNYHNNCQEDYNHTTFNPSCRFCKDVDFTCYYATKEGYADFTDHDRLNPNDWAEMISYHKKSLEVEGGEK